MHTDQCYLAFNGVDPVTLGGRHWNGPTRDSTIFSLASQTFSGPATFSNLLSQLDGFCCGGLESAVSTVRWQILGNVVDVHRVPEPDAMSLIGLGVAALGFARRKRGSLAPSGDLTKTPAGR